MADIDCLLYYRAVAATTASTAMAVPVFVGTKKKKDSHMHVRTRARTTIKVQSSNSKHMLAFELREWPRVLQVSSSSRGW